MYYKVIYNSIIIDILYNPKWVIWLRKSNRFALTDSTTANGVVSSNDNGVYNLCGKKPFENYAEEYKIVTVVEIDKEEYQLLLAQIDSGSTVYDDAMKTAIENAKISKIAEMSDICNKTIVAGFDIVLSDNNKYHFSLTVQDQLNLITLSSMVSSGQVAVPYHADNELCKYYSAADMLRITNMATVFKSYHTTYFNSLKAYIQSLNDKDSIEQVYYGIQIEEKYQSDVLKGLLLQMNGGK